MAPAPNSRLSRSATYNRWHPASSDCPEVAEHRIRGVEGLSADRLDEGVGHVVVTDDAEHERYVGQQRRPYRELGEVVEERRFHRPLPVGGVDGVHSKWQGQRHGEDDQERAPPIPPDGKAAGHSSPISHGWRRYFDADYS